MFARTPRLLLRPGWMEDAPALVQAIGNEAVLRNLTRTPSPYTIGDAHNFLAQPHDPRTPSLLAFSRTRGAPRLVGGCGVTAMEDGRAELSYWIARPYWGLGFATEAARAVVSMARAHGVRDICAMHFADNPASGNVLRKIGFRLTGEVERRFSPARGTMSDCLVMEEGESARMASDLALELYGDVLTAMAA